MSDTLEIGWGLQPPSGVQMAWGARAIWPSEDVGFVPDRISFKYGTSQDYKLRNKLYSFLKNGAIDKLKKTMKSERLSSSESKLITIQFGGFTLEANPNSSHGYLYMGCWPTLNK